MTLDRLYIGYNSALAVVNVSGLGSIVMSFVSIRDNDVLASVDLGSVGGGPAEFTIGLGVYGVGTSLRRLVGLSQVVRTGYLTLSKVYEDAAWPFGPTNVTGFMSIITTWYSGVLAMPHVRVLTPNLEVSYNPNITELRLPALVSVVGKVTITNNTMLQILRADNLTSVGSGSKIVSNLMLPPLCAVNLGSGSLGVTQNSNGGGGGPCLA